MDMSRELADAEFLAVAEQVVELGAVLAEGRLEVEDALEDLLHVAMCSPMPVRPPSFALR